MRDVAAGADAFDDWPALLRTVCALLSSTPDEMVRSISVSIPNAGDNQHLLPYLCTWLEDQYGVEVTIERQPALSEAGAEP